MSLKQANRLLRKRYFAEFHRSFSCCKSDILIR